MYRIAAISSEQFISRILKYEELFPDIKITPFIYDYPTESEDLIDRIVDCDVLLFAGPLPYYLAQEKLKNKNWPAVFIPVDEYTITLSIFHAMLHQSDGLKQISIDIPEASYINQVSEELGIDTSGWSVYIHDIENPLQFNAEEIIQFHKAHYETNKSTFVLTCVEIVQRRLSQLGIPCSLMLDPEKNIKDTLNKAIMQAQISIGKSSQVAAGFFVFNQQEVVGNDLESLKNDAIIVLQKHLLDLVKETETSIQQLEIDQLILYGTRGSVEQLVDKTNLFPFLRKIDKFPGITISMGFGFGSTLKEAEDNARIGLFYAQKNQDVCNVYLVTDEKEVIGPLHSNTTSYYLKSDSKRVLEIAEKTGISVSSLSKLHHFLKLHPDNQVTANELAEYLKISRRSAERLLKKLKDQHYVEKVGEEQPYQKGRPRSLYRISLD